MLNIKEELRIAIKKLEDLEGIANKAEEAYDADPENEEKEAAFDAAYRAEFAAFIVATNLLVEMTNGRIGEKMAREMIRTKRNEILNLVA